MEGGDLVESNVFLSMHTPHRRAQEMFPVEDNSMEYGIVFRKKIFWRLKKYTASFALPYLTLVKCFSNIFKYLEVN